MTSKLGGGIPSRCSKAHKQTRGAEKIPNKCGRHFSKAHLSESSAPASHPVDHRILFLLHRMQLKLSIAAAAALYAPHRDKALSLSLLYIAAATAVTPSHPDPFHSSCVLATDRHALAPISRYPCEAPYAASICVTSILESFVPGSTLTSTLFVRRLDLPSPIQPRIPWPSLPTANAEAPPSALSCSNMGNIVFPPPPSSIPAAPCFFLLFLPSMFQAPRSIRRRHTGCDKVICCKQGLPS